VHIVVCVKQVPDPEGPPSSFVVHPEQRRVEPRGIAPVLSPFDENALEAALRIRDLSSDPVIVTVLTLGWKTSHAVLSKALAAGADSLVKVDDPLFDTARLDSHGTALALASSIRRIGGFDLVLAGRQSADWNAGTVGVFLAEFLGIPAVTLARKVEMHEGHVRIERLLPNGYEVIRSPVPCLVVVSNEVGELRYPTLMQRKGAVNKPVTVWRAEDIGVQGQMKPKTVLRRLFRPAMREGRCIRIAGATPTDAGRELAGRLRQDGIIGN